MKNINFNLYRYQILPKDRYFQGSLFGEIKTIEDLIAQKNDLFYSSIKTITNWKGKKSSLKGQLEYDKDDFLLFRFAPKRTTKIENENFEEEQLENWPSILVGIWNHPEKQIIVIQDRKKAFSDTKAVLKILLESINNALESKQLKLYGEPIFHKEAFWSIIEQYDRKIKNIKFELITPNMANISGVLSDDLKNLAKGTNTAKTLLEIDADDDSTLHIDKQNKQVGDLVEYASEGGGNISLKAKGVKKRIQTANAVKSVEIGEIEISSDNAERIAEILKRALE